MKMHIVICSLTSSGQVGYHLRRTPSFEHRSLEGVKNMLDARGRWIQWFRER